MDEAKMLETLQDIMKANKELREEMKADKEKHQEALAARDEAHQEALTAKDELYAKQNDQLESLIAKIQQGAGAAAGQGSLGRRSWGHSSQDHLIKFYDQDVNDSGMFKGHLVCVI